MGKQPIPNAKLALIQQLMSETSSTESDIITITIPAEFEERVRAEAAKLHLAIDEFVMKTLADKAAMAAKFSKTTQDALAAHEASMAAAGVAPEDETPEEMKQRLTDSLPKFNAVKKQEKQKKNNHKSA